MDYGQIFLGVILAVLGYLLVDLRQQVSRQLDQHTRDIANIREEQARHRERLPTIYVLREDWIRTTAAMESKIDGLRRAIEDLPATVATAVTRASTGRREA